MKKLFTFILFIGLISPLAKAQNLVSNASLEDADPLNTSCPSGYFNPANHAAYYAAHWSATKGNGTADYLHTCGSPFTNPLTTSLGTQTPKDGDAFAGLITYSNAPNFHFDGNHVIYAEYIHQELAQALEVGQEYYIEFWVSLAEKSAYASKYLGLHLSNDSSELVPETGKDFGLHQLTPQIPNSFPALQAYTDSTGWTKISGFYTPIDSGVKYITIGNFDPNYDTTVLATGNHSNPEAYYYIDDIRIIEAPTNMTISGDAALCANSTATYSIPINDPDDDVIWTTSANLTIIGSNDQFTVTVSNGTATGSAWVQATVNGRAYRQDIWLGKPVLSLSHLDGASSAQAGGNRSWTYNGTVQGATEIEWRPNESCPPFAFDPCWKVLQSSGSSFAHFQVGSNNTYVQMVAKNACGNRAAIKFVTITNDDGACCDVPQMRTAKDLESKHTDIKIYPNPAANFIHIELPSSYYEDKGAQITLYHAQSGQLIESVSTHQHTSLDISAVKKGIYLLKIETATETLNKKVIIN
ncbi:MAG: T9SS type A sorting domain-containing protein [Flammeovirgaceae bacterium]